MIEDECIDMELYCQDKNDEKTLQKNREIDLCFMKIRDIARTYLEIHYPEAPDPDIFIEKIEQQIKRYREIV